jgi:hypothetical protein
MVRSAVVNVVAKQDAETTSTVLMSLGKVYIHLSVSLLG